jgi:hypothetical protein
MNYQIQETKELKGHGRDAAEIFLSGLDLL